MRAGEAESFAKQLLAKVALLRLLKRKSPSYNGTKPIFGHVAQLDRASDSGSDGRGFESLHARKIK